MANTIQLPDRTRTDIMNVCVPMNTGPVSKTLLDASLTYKHVIQLAMIKWTNIRTDRLGQAPDPMSEAARPDWSRRFLVTMSR